MAQISIHKPIIKKRMQTFHAKKGQKITTKKILGYLAKPAAYITAKAQDPKTRKAVGSFLTRLSEGSQRFAEAQRRKQAPRRTKRKSKKRSR